MVNFVKPIYVIGWQNNMMLFQIPVNRGLEMMGRSYRWDDNHASANIRVLQSDDRKAANTKLKLDIPDSYPVIFTQDPPAFQETCDEL